MNSNEIYITGFKNMFGVNIEFVNKITDKDIKELILEVDTATEFNNKEGYVVLLNDGTRFKLKFKPYFALHKTMTGYSIIRLCELLIDAYLVNTNTKINDVLEQFPDEIYDKVKSDMDIIKAKYDRIYDTCYMFYTDNLDICLDRKSYAIKVFADGEVKNYASIAFDLLDNREVKASIFKIVLNELKK